LEFPNCLAIIIINYMPAITERDGSDVVSYPGGADQIISPPLEVLMAMGTHYPLTQQVFTN
jgi:hypothetical protein